MIKRKHIIIIAVNALLLIAFVVCLALSASLRNSLRSQQAARAWAGQSGERFAQLSVFFPEHNQFDAEGIHNVRTAVERAMLDVSLEATPGRTLYTDAWSANHSVFVISDRNTATAPVIAVGGDFFLFHPLRLRDGSYLSPNDIRHDRVVLDEELAWRLFGSVHVAGFDVSIDNKPFVIAGVISRESDFASSRAYTAYTDDAGMFMSFEALMAMTEGGAKITSYEIVMPDPITGYAMNALSEHFKDSDVHIVENSTRFSLQNSFALIGSFGERSMRTDAIALPYWENAARFTEDWLALLLLLMLILITFPVVCGVIYCVKLIRFGIRCGLAAISGQIKARDQRKYEQYLLEHHDERHIYDIEDFIREVQDEM